MLLLALEYQFKILLYKIIVHILLGIYLMIINDFFLGHILFDMQLVMQMKIYLREKLVIRVLVYTKICEIGNFDV